MEPRWRNGRRGRLKICFPRGSGGSIPSLGTARWKTSSRTSPERAKNLGDNFVRMVKTFGPDDSPGEDIGTGLFDYLLAVAYPDETIIVQGAKARSSSRISG